jgi:hypothetical protein
MDYADLLINFRKLDEIPGYESLVDGFQDVNRWKPRWR